MRRINHVKPLIVVAMAAILTCFAFLKAELLPSFLSATKLPLASVTYSLVLRTTASEGEVLNFASGEPSKFRQGFYLQLTPPNATCYDNTSAETVHGALLLIVADDPMDMTFCSRTRINDGKPHAVRLKFLPSSIMLTVDDRDELVQHPNLKLQAIEGVGRSAGTIVWAPVLSQSISERRIMVERSYPDPVN